MGTCLAHSLLYVTGDACHYAHYRTAATLMVENVALCGLLILDSLKQSACAT